MVKGHNDWVSYLGQHLDKIIWISGFGYLLAVSLWLFQQQRLPWIERSSPSSQAIKDAKITQNLKEAENRRFIAYLQQALKGLESGKSVAINSQSSIAIPSAVESPNFSTVILPKPNSLPPSTLPSVSNSVGLNPKVVERYYYPVYPTVPNPSALSPVNPVSRSAVATIPRGVSINPKSLPTIKKISPIVAVKPPVVSSSSGSAATPVDNSIQPMVTTKVRYSLVGVLESGDRSSALFNWNHLTQRLQIGDSIGASGWVLTGVDDQKAILSRQGKTRYLEVGQSF